MPNLLLPIIIACGIAFGSFLTMLIPRIHEKEGGILFGRSKCFACKKKLQIRDLIPVLSYLWTRGKCRQCDKKVSAFYPIIELTTGTVFGLTYWLFPFTDVSGMPLTMFYLLMSLILIFTFFYDLRYLEISDWVLIPGTMIALIATEFDATPNLLSALIGMGIGTSFFLVQIVISKGRWVGGGDIRIGAFMGALLGWQMTLAALVISYIIGSLVSIPLLISGDKKLDGKVPLGPFLVTGTFVVLFWGEQITDWYLNLFL